MQLREVVVAGVMLAAALSGARCHPPEPEPPPAPPDRCCEVTCQWYRAAGCPVETPAGTTCEQVCRDVEAELGTGQFCSLKECAE